METTIRR